MFFHSYWFMKERLFGLLMVYSNRYCILKTVGIINFWIYCCWIFVWCPTVEAYLIAHIMLSWNIINNKAATLHRLFQIYLILMHKWIKKFLDDFACIISNHNSAAITLRIHRTFSLRSVDEIDLGFILKCIFHSSNFRDNLSDHWSVVLFFQGIFSLIVFCPSHSTYHIPKTFTCSTYLPSKASAITLVYSSWVCYYLFLIQKAS